MKLYERNINLAERSTEPYATHVPILVGIAAAFEPQSVIEFGSGTFSTLAFSNEMAFPTIRRVDSYENNQEWFNQVRKELSPDARVHLHLVEEKMHNAVGAANTTNADLIFIDDSPTALARVPTVKEVARQCGVRPIVILHDNDLWRLRLASRAFEHHVSFNAFNPQCSVMWHGHPERIPVVQRVGQIIRQYSASTPVTNIEAWTQAFARKLR